MPENHTQYDKTEQRGLHGQYYTTDTNPPIRMRVNSKLPHSPGEEYILFLEGCAPGLGIPNERSIGGKQETILHLVTIPEETIKSKINGYTIVGKNYFPEDNKIVVYVQGHHDDISGRHIQGATGAETEIELEDAYHPQEINPLTFEQTRARLGDPDPNPRDMD